MASNRTYKFLGERNNMYEKNLKRIVCLFPELIEEGLTIEEEEYPIRSSHTTYRCDLKGKENYQFGFPREIAVDQDNSSQKFPRKDGLQ
jgi:hypothetical protein